MVIRQLPLHKEFNPDTIEAFVEPIKEKDIPSVPTIKATMTASFNRRLMLFT